MNVSNPQMNNITVTRNFAEKTSIASTSLQFKGVRRIFIHVQVNKVIV